MRSNYCYYYFGSAVRLGPDSAVETSWAVLNERQYQIDVTKSTEAYRKYSRLVPKYEAHSLF